MIEAKDGLNDQQRQAIIAVFRLFPQIESALLYGSRALGRYREGSDIDISLVGDIDMMTLNRISLQLDDLLLPYEIDLSVFRDIDNIDLINHIQRVGVKFYTKL